MAELQIKASNDDLKAHYSNAMQVAHGKEEFWMDFFSSFAPAGVLIARIVVSPGHLKRMVAALNDNLEKYEKQYGKIEPAKGPEDGIGFKP